MKYNFPKSIWVIIFISTILYSKNNQKITGQIIDSKTKDGIENVNIYVDNFKIGASSSVDGFFTINNDSINFPITLLIDHIGYALKKIIVTN